jgi:hypothetical protein
MVWTVPLNVVLLETISYIIGNMYEYCFQNYPTINYC